ncbi:hypothetical protein WOLCODRAFT_136373 [Wolfiporia cocos MD-104 SS10]|uniref:Uncharacterized protein n=1 Tax=Wolfiporia cocos (strain MD-104) TaxID=742152 RepID=A0A2H3J9N2_WOLCO|nr:hypothetical protein WOLCODRAFT_136373 [Wolfiporia cocos MD-104 SS10]
MSSGISGSENKSRKTGKRSENVASSKRKALSKETVEDSDNEWDYKPPAGAVLCDRDVDFGEFDWDTIKDDENLELWVVRIPNSLKAKYINDLKLNAPSSSITAKIGTVDRKTASYDIWSLGEDENDVVGGEEVKGLSCLLPRQRKGGKLFQAPKPIARHLVITAKPDVPTPAHAEDARPVAYQNPPRPRYPAEVLTHRFAPLGSLVGTSDSQEAMDVDEPEKPTKPIRSSQNSPAKSPRTKRNVPAETGEITKKRRKAGDEESTKKTK